MKQFIFLTIIILLSYKSILPQIEIDTLNQITISESSRYLPEYLNNVHIGMSIAEFENIKDTLDLNSISSSTESEMIFSESILEAGIDSVIYYFNLSETNTDLVQPLYRISITFLTPDYMNDYLRDVLHLSQDEIEDDIIKWGYPTDRNFYLIFKQNELSIIISATIPGEKD